MTDFIALAALAAFCVGMSKGGLPAFAGLSVPLMALRIDPLVAAALLLPIYLVSDIFGVWLYRREFSARNLSILIPTGLSGVLIGYLLAPYLSVPVINIMLALIGFAYCARAWVGGAYLNKERGADLPRGILWGTTAGVTSFISHSGAVPFQMFTLPQKLPKMVFAGTATFTFAAINLAKLPPYLALGNFPKFEMWPTTALVVSAIAGVFVGRTLTKIVPDWLFFRFVEIALFAISTRLMWRAIEQLT